MQGPLFLAASQQRHHLNDLHVDADPPLSATDTLDASHVVYLHDALGPWGALGLVSLLALALLYLATMLRSAIFTLTVPDVALLRAQSDIRGQLIAYLHQEQRQLLATFILAQMVAVAILFSVVALAGSALHGSAWLVMLACNVAAAFAGVLLPYAIGSRMQQKGLLRYAFWMLSIFQIASPLVRALLRLAQPLSNKGGVRQAEEVKPDELDTAPSLAQTTGRQELDILKGIPQFGAVPVRQVMTPRMAIIGIPAKADYHQVMDRINKEGFSRYPVLGEALDQVLGVLYVKDLLPHTNEGEAFHWRRYLREPLYVPEGKMIDELLRDFQQGKTHMALVVDEYGGLQGLITLEDILEEIVGEIQDEFDAEDPTIIARSATSWQAEGRTPLNDLLRTIGLDAADVAEERGQSETIAGLLLEVAGRMPRQGETFTAGPLQFKILSASAKQIKRVLVEQLVNNE